MYKALCLVLVVKTQGKVRDRSGPQGIHHSLEREIGNRHDQLQTYRKVGFMPYERKKMLW